MPPEKMARWGIFNLPLGEVARSAGRVAAAGKRFAACAAFLYFPPARPRRRRGRRPRRPAHRQLTHFNQRRTGRRLRRRPPPPITGNFRLSEPPPSRHMARAGLEPAPTGNLEGYPIQPTSEDFETRVAGDGDPYGVMEAVLFVRTALSSYARFPPAPLLRGGGSETGAGAGYRNRFNNATSFAPPTEGWREAPGWCCDPFIGSPSYVPRARIPRRRGGTPFSEKGVGGIRLRRFEPRLY